MLPTDSQQFVPAQPQARTVYRVSRQDLLRRILGQTGKTIHDVVNCPIARQTVAGYFKLSRNIDRRSEVVELEKQWNPLGLRL